MRRNTLGDFCLAFAKPLDVNRSIFLQGCAKMTSRIGGSVAGGNWKYAHGTAHYGRNFSVKWLKVQKLFHHLPYSIYLSDSNNPKLKLNKLEAYLIRL